MPLIQKLEEITRHNERNGIFKLINSKTATEFENNKKQHILISVCKQRLQKNKELNHA